MVNIKILPPQPPADDDDSNFTVQVDQQQNQHGEHELEECFIIRFPAHVASVLHELLKRKRSAKRIKRVLQIDFGLTLQDAKVYFQNELLPARMVQLPTIVEVTKSTNNVNIFKTGVATQMLIVGDHPTLADPKCGEQWPHGICPSLKNVKKKRFRKPKRNQEELKDAADVQKEVALLLRADYEAVSTRFEIIYDGPPDVEEIVTEESLFGLMSGSESDSGTSQYDIMEFH